TALGSVAVHHGLLHRVKLTIRCLKTLDGNQFFTVDGWQEANAGIDSAVFNAATVWRQVAQNHGTSPAITFGTAFLRPRAACKISQVLQHGDSRRHPGHGDNLPVEHEADGLGVGRRSCLHISCRGTWSNSRATLTEERGSSVRHRRPRTG